MSKRTAKRETFLADILTTAVEGGINYWGGVSAYMWFDPTLEGGTAEPAPSGGGNAYATIVEDEDGTEHDVTLDTIAHGISVILSGESRFIGKSIIKEVFNCNIENDAAPDDSEGIDANLADIILQVGIFGEIVYG